MKKRIAKFKKGAASFYIVAFSTLILLILAVSFATVIMSEVERTSNEDLSQSAYDSAMAGVEDAKLAFYNYQTCKTKSYFEMSAACKDIVAMMEDPNPDCYMVGRILGRIGQSDETEVAIETTSGSAANNMQQAYTCVKIYTVLNDYRSTLSATNPMRIVKVKLKSGVTADDIEKVRVSWYSGTEETKWTNFFGNKIVFPAIGQTTTATPPTISVALVQTAESFQFSDFDQNYGNTTDRAMVYLTPVGSDNLAKAAASSAKTSAGSYGGYRAAYNGSENVISASALVDSNDHEKENVPYAVYCGGDGEFLCSTTLDLPDPVGGERNDDTFMLVIALPYGRPTTEFAVELLCKEGEKDRCGTVEMVTKGDGTEEAVTTNISSFSGVQVKIDSTGRANDLYRRVEARLESAADSSFISLLGPLELYDDGTGNDSEKGLVKDYTVINEFHY